MPKSNVTDSNNVTINGYALDARQNNPNIKDTLANKIAQMMNNHGLFIENFAGQRLGFPNQPISWLGKGFTEICVGDTEETKLNSPLPNVTHAVHYNVLTFGSYSPTRITQVAFYGFLNQGQNLENAIWVRTQHDNNVSAWKRII